MVPGFNQAVDPGAGWWHAPHRNLERCDPDGVLEFDLVGLARHSSTEPQIAGEGFGAIPMIAFTELFPPLVAGRVTGFENDQLGELVGLQV